MLDKEQISLMIRDIEKYLFDLETMGINSKKDLEDKEKYYAVSMIIFASFNRAIDMGNELISGSDSMPTLSTYKEIFEVLSKHNVISSALAQQMGKLMKYRNAIAHNYYQISTEELYSIKSKMHYLSDFVSEVRKFASKR